MGGETPVSGCANVRNVADRHVGSGILCAISATMKFISACVIAIAPFIGAGCDDARTSIDVDGGLDTPPVDGDPGNETSEVVVENETTFFVATDGDDSRSCETANSSRTPKKTINNGMKCLKPGDTLYIRAGVYREAIRDNESTRIPSGTSWSSPVTIAGYPKERVIMRPDAGLNDVIRVMGPAGGTHHVIFRNLVLDAVNQNVDTVPGGKTGIKMTYTGRDPANEAHHIRVEDCEIMNAADSGILGCGVGSEILRNNVHHNGNSRFDHGIYCNSEGLLIEGNDFHHNSGWGIHVYKSGGVPGPNIVVRGNLSHDNNTAKQGGNGIILGGKNNTAYNNIVWNNETGIQVTYGRASDLKVYNNTVYGNDVGISVSDASNVQVINNIVFNNRRSISVLGATPGLVNDNNPSADPLFVDADKRDFRLKAGSPAIDKGTDLSKEGVLVDFNKKPRPMGAQFDIGAHEFAAP